MAVQPFYGAGQLFPQIPVNVPLSAAAATGHAPFQPHPAYVFGERVVRPALDLTAQFIGGAAHRISTMVRTFFEQEQTSSTDRLEKTGDLREKELKAYVTMTGSGAIGVNDGGLDCYRLHGQEVQFSESITLTQSPPTEVRRDVNKETVYVLEKAPGWNYPSFVDAVSARSNKNLGPLSGVESSRVLHNFGVTGQCLYATSSSGGNDNGLEVAPLTQKDSEDCYGHPPVYRIGLQDLPSGLTLLADGKIAAVASQEAQTVSFVDLGIKNVTDILSGITSIQHPDGMTVSDGVLYVANKEPSVTVIQNGFPGHLVSKIPLKGSPLGITIANGYLYALNGQEITVLDPTTGQTITNITIAPGPIYSYGGMALTPDGGYLFSLIQTEKNPFNWIVIDTASNTVIDRSVISDTTSGPPYSMVILEVSKPSQAKKMKIIYISVGAGVGALACSVLVGCIAYRRFRQKKGGEHQGLINQDDTA